MFYNPENCSLFIVTEFEGFFCFSPSQLRKSQILDQLILSKPDFLKQDIGLPSDLAPKYLFDHPLSNNQSVISLPIS